MLTTLRIKNLALVDDLTVELQPGYNAITGETGAGKSIIMGALNLVLGQRADRTLIRSGADNCSVEAVFDVEKLNSPLKNFLEENGLEPCEENQLVLKRTFSAAGTNKQFVNGSPTTLNNLASIGEWLVDMHGPHEHQSLLNPSRQLAILDAFGGLEKCRNRFAETLQKRAGLERAKAELIIDERTYAQQIDLLRHQVNEISSAKLRAGEETEVEGEYTRASNASRLLQLGQMAQEILSENENSLLNQFGAVGRTLQELHRVDPAAGCLTNLHEQALQIIRELQDELSSYVERVDLDPAKLHELEERINILHSLKRKYGHTLAEVIAFGEGAWEKLRSLEQRDEELARINAETQKLDSELWKIGKEISTERRKLIPKLCKSVVKHLNDLGFKQSQFEISISSLLPKEIKDDEKPAFLNSGLDTIEFLFAPNPGEPARPLRAIASSGEMARVMLALKTVLAAEDEVPVLVFDEVDANIGGETATVVGEKMLQIARQRQVLCITHLPAVAAAANAHFCVNKEVKSGRTISEITLLDPTERITEIARMLGGQSDAARKHAKSLLMENRTASRRKD
ncbi:MAG: DNA repair protein RecN [Verrucomicrobia bacterium]|nr:DNA repair protein RecN [Verrucomicrobiota bacterium]